MERILRKGDMVGAQPTRDRLQKLQSLKDRRKFLLRRYDNTTDPVLRKALAQEISNNQRALETLDAGEGCVV